MRGSPLVSVLPAKEHLIVLWKSRDVFARVGGCSQQGRNTPRQDLLLQTHLLHDSP